MSKPKYEREFEQLEALHLAWRRHKAPSRNDPRFALAFAYLDRIGLVKSAADDRRREEARLAEEKRREQKRKDDELRATLRSYWRK
jgi:hypothetical protein